MEQNKLKLKDYCLTIEQAKELQALGVNMSDSMMVHFTLIDGTKIICERYELSGDKDYIDTLTNTEMLEMLPKEIDGYKLTFVYDYFRNGDDKYYIGYLKTYSAPLKELESTLLRNSLFGMIKWLKINKLM